MKKTHFIELLKNIKKTRVSFISLVAFVALGIGVYLGFSWIGFGLEETATDFANRYNLHNISISAPLGLAEKDLEGLSHLDDVDEVEGGYTAYGYFDLKGNQYEAKIFSLPQKVDCLLLQEGHLPEKSNEIALELDFAKDNNLHLGDKIVFRGGGDSEQTLLRKVMNFDRNSDDIESYFSEEDAPVLLYSEYTVCGIVVSPIAANTINKFGASSLDGAILDTGCFVHPSAFNKDVFPEYNNAYIYSNSIKDLYSHSEAFIEKNDVIKAAVEKQLSAQNAEKKAALLAQINVLEEAVQAREEEYKDKIRQGERDIAKGEEDLAKGRLDIVKGRDEIAKGREEIAEGEQTLSDAALDLSESRTALEEGAFEIAAGEKELKEGEEEYAKGEAKLRSAKRQLSAARSEYNAASAQYDQSVSDYEAFKDGPVLCTEIETAVQNGKIHLSIPEDVATKKLYAFEYAVFLAQNNRLQRIGRFAAAVNHNRSHIIDYLKEELQVEVNLSEIDAFIDSFGGVIQLGPEAIKAALENGQEALEDVAFGILIQSLFNLSHIYDQVAGVTGTWETARLHMEMALTVMDQGLQAASSELSWAAAEIRSAQRQINAGEAELAEAKKVLDGAREKLDKAKEEYNASYDLFEGGADEYEQGITDLQDGREKLQDSEAALQSAIITLMDSERQLADGKVELADAKASLAKASEEMAEQLNQLREKADYADMQLGTRASMVYLNSVDVLTGMTKSLRFSMAGLFFLIGLLVCYSVITRIIFSQVVQIGTKKALGFEQREVTLYYLLYVTCATIVGAFIGLGVALGCEKLILNSVHKSLLFDRFVVHFSMVDALLVVGLQLGMLLGVSFLASHQILKRRAIELLSGVGESAGKTHFYEKFGLWKKLPLYNKIVVNNFVTDKRRIAATIVGIMGCTALIVTGMNFKRSVDKSYVNQFEKYYQFDNVVYFDTTKPEASLKIKEVLNKYDVDNAECMFTMATLVEPDGKNSVVTIYVPMNGEDFQKLVKMEIYESESPQADPYQGIWAQCSYRNYHKEKAGFDLMMNTARRSDIPIHISGYMENHAVIGQMVAYKEAYEAQFGEAAVANAYLCSFGNVDTLAMEDELKNIDGYIKSDVYVDSIKFGFLSISSLSNALAGLYIALAVVLSVLMIYNLFVQFIDEKKKELIVMRINGFSLRDVDKYIYSDAIVQTIIGVLFGALLGSGMGLLAVAGFESSLSYFAREADLLSAFVGIAGASLMTFVMCLLALRRVHKFKLTDISK